ncbi:MAG TPA: hypothetical protein VF522_16150 [Ramlibacter sp.]|uniref:hypothetical protein n=1 Tax=Ramlibacter sp. TaxID=1917967 RepID=UPI002ED51D93
MLVVTRLLAAGLCAAAAVTAVQAQQLGRKSPAPIVTPGRTATGPAITGSTATTRPSVRAELFPAEVSPGSTPPGVAPPQPGTVVLLPDGTSVFSPAATDYRARRAGAYAAAPDTTVMGSAISCGASASDEVRAFLYADGDQDCQLTRAEARLLGPTTRTFDEMDRNSDGFVTRAEFDASLR